MSDRPLRSVRPLALVGAAASVLLLTGCVNPFTLAEQLQERQQQVQQHGATTREPTVEVEVEEHVSSFEGDLTFERGSELEAESFIEWGDGLLADDAWEMSSPDDGNGNWSYVTTDGLCRAAFWQGRLLDGFDLSVGDRTLSDQLLGVKLGATAAEVEPFGADDTFTASTGGSVDVRAVTGADGGATWVVAGRGFAQPAAGHTLVVDCAAGRDATEVYAEVTEKSSLVVW